MVVNESLAPGETSLVASGAYTWQADGKPLPITETWRILEARSGHVLETMANAADAPAFGHVYDATLSVDASGRATGLAMTVTKAGNTVAVSAHFELDGAVVTRGLRGEVEGAIQRTQTFRLPDGYTIEAHPVLFDGLHIAACDLSFPGPCQRPALWFDIISDEAGALMAAHPVSLAIEERTEGVAKGTFAITRWGGDTRAADTLITVRRTGRWLIPTELRFTMAGVLYSARLTDEQWESR